MYSEIWLWTSYLILLGLSCPLCAMVMREMVWENNKGHTELRAWPTACTGPRGAPTSQLRHCHGSKLKTCWMLMDYLLNRIQQERNAFSEEHAVSCVINNLRFPPSSTHTQLGGPSWAWPSLIHRKSAPSPQLWLPPKFWKCFSQAASQLRDVGFLSEPGWEALSGYFPCPNNASHQGTACDTDDKWSLHESLLWEHAGGSFIFFLQQPTGWKTACLFARHRVITHTGKLFLSTWSLFSSPTSKNAHVGSFRLAWCRILPSPCVKLLLFRTVAESWLRSRGAHHLEKEPPGLGFPCCPLLGRLLHLGVLISVLKSRQ